MSLFPLKIRFLQKGCLYYLTKFNKNNLVKGGLFYYLRHFCWDNEKDEAETLQKQQLYKAASAWGNTFFAARQIPPG